MRRSAGVKTVPGGGKKSPNAIQRQRYGLYKIVHVAMKQLGMDDATYREALLNWGVKSKTAMSIPELEDLVDFFKNRGFRKKRTPDEGRGTRDEGRRTRGEGRWVE